MTDFSRLANNAASLTVTQSFIAVTMLKLGTLADRTFVKWHAPVTEHI
jgi:hypothetical protein